MTLTNRLVSEYFHQAWLRLQLLLKKMEVDQFWKKKKRGLKSSFFYDLLKVKKYYTSEIIVGRSCVRDNCSGNNYLGDSYSARGNLSCHRTSVIWHQAWTFFFWVHNFTCAPDRARKKKQKKTSGQNQSVRPIEKQDFWPSFLTFLLKVLAMRVL